jgi:uncharacterized membrane protein YkoI
MWAKSFLSAIVIAASIIATPAMAQQIPLVQPGFIMPVQERERGQAIRPLREITDMLRSRFGGELVGARLEQGERPIYQIRWRMPNNELRDFAVDAVTGQIR